MTGILLIDRRLSLLRNKMTRNYGMILSTILWINQVFDSVLLSLRSWRFVWREREKAEKTRVKRAFSSLPPLGFAAHLRARPTKPRHTFARSTYETASYAGWYWFA